MLAKYVVLTRGHPGCRNVDLVASVTHPGRFLVIEKWDSPEAQRAHLDSADMVEMAEACHGLLAEPPDIDLSTRSPPTTSPDLRAGPGAAAGGGTGRDQTGGVGLRGRPRATGRRPT